MHVHDTLVALLVGEDKPCRSENALFTILSDLEDRGLLGWDRRANRYDLHPIVRGVTWSRLGYQDKAGIYKTLSAHFESLPMIDSDDWEKVNNLEDLTAAIELYYTLIGLGRYDDAETLYVDRLENAFLYRLGAYRESAELLQMSFPDGLDQLPHLSIASEQSRMLNDLALSFSDQMGHAAKLYRRSIQIDEREGNQELTRGTLCNLSEALRFSGALRESETAARRALLITRQMSDQVLESYSLSLLGITLAARGRKLDSSKALNHSLELSLQSNWFEPYDSLSMCAFWFEEYVDAQKFADKAVTYFQEKHIEWRVIFAIHLQGEAALGLSDLTIATEAYQLAWCDGPPFAYHWGLQKAKAHLAALGVPEPILPPFDESKYDPMPEVEIEPLDEEEDDFEIEP